MSAETRHLLTELGKLTTIAVIVGLLLGNAWLAIRNRTLRMELVVETEKASKARADTIRRKSELQKLGRLQNLASHRAYEKTGHDKELNVMMSACSSSKDFIVREGPRFAWSELSSSTEHDKRIAIYVPAGKHTLKYASLATDRSRDRTAFRTGDARKIEDAVRVQLADTEQVYELVLAHDGRGTLLVSLFGPRDELIHQQSLPFMDAPCRLGLSVRRRSPAFPNEMKFDLRASQHFEAGKSAPVSELASMFIQEDKPKLPRRQANLRIWIESDARPSMPAIDVLANYREVLMLRQSRRSRNRSPEDANRLRDQEFNNLFHPYDQGSQRFYFRAGAFAQ